MGQTENIHIRLTKEQKDKIENNSKKYTFSNVSEFMRFVSLNITDIEVKIESK